MKKTDYEGSWIYPGYELKIEVEQGELKGYLLQIEHWTGENRVNEITQKYKTIGNYKLKDLNILSGFTYSNKNGRWVGGKLHDFQNNRYEKCYMELNGETLHLVKFYGPLGLLKYTAKFNKKQLKGEGK